MVIPQTEDIDLLVVVLNLQLALIIENEVDAGEHDDQLELHFERVGDTCRGYSVSGLFLTPQGSALVISVTCPFGTHGFAELVQLVLDGL